MTEDNLLTPEEICEFMPDGIIYLDQKIYFAHEIAKAQLAKDKDIIGELKEQVKQDLILVVGLRNELAKPQRCPECGGKRRIPDIGITNGWKYCPTCQGTGKKARQAKELPTTIPDLCVVNMREGRGYPRCVESLFNEEEE